MARFAEQETTTTIGELRVGDFLVLVHTQERLRGYRIDSGISSLVPQRFKRGRREIVEGSVIRTLRGTAPVAYPNHFTAIVRRRLED
jgi:hypothetical protein